MASVAKESRSDGSVRWVARYRTPDGASRKRRFDRKADAERFLTSIEHSKLSDTYVDPMAGRVLLEDYAEGWRELQVWRVSTAVQVEGNLRRHLYPALGQRPIGSIRTSEVQAWVKALSSVLAPGTVELVYRYLVSIYRAAILDRMVHISPCQGIKLPKAERRQVFPMTVDEVRSLAKAMPDRYRGLITFTAGTGLRQGEAFGLKVDRIDFLRRTVRIDQQLTLVREKPTLGPLKTGSSYRTIPLAASTIEALAAHLAALPAVDGFVFTNDRDEPISRTRFSDVWRPARATAGIPTDRTFHDLRHFYASLLIYAGCSVKAVQNRLGHASAAETLDTYSHLWPDDEDRTRAAVDDVLGQHSAQASR